MSRRNAATAMPPAIRGRQRAAAKRAQRKFARHSAGEGAEMSMSTAGGMS